MRSYDGCRPNRTPVTTAGAMAARSTRTGAVPVGPGVAVCGSVTGGGDVSGDLSGGVGGEVTEAVPAGSWPGAPQEMRAVQQRTAAAARAYGVMLAECPVTGAAMRP